jgi:hypothetical protein
LSVFNAAFRESLSKRINAVVLMWDKVDLLPEQNAGSPVSWALAAWNASPRHPLFDVDKFDIPPVSYEQPVYADSFYDWLKRVQSKYASTIGDYRVAGQSGENLQNLEKFKSANASADIEIEKSL